MPTTAPSHLSIDDVAALDLVSEQFARTIRDGLAKLRLQAREHSLDEAFELATSVLPAGVDKPTEKHYWTAAIITGLVRAGVPIRHNGKLLTA